MILHSQHLLRFVACIFFGLQFMSCHVCVAAAPAFINESIYSSNKASVSAIDPNLAADLVTLDGGLDQGIRLGMVCLIERDTQPIGELIIIESKSRCSIALILSLTGESTIRSGDIVRIKTLQNS